jgi:WD40 repeat protein/serine/threonine protein kinase
MASQAANWVGQSLGGRYQITAQLGEGGMGTVFKAHDDRLGCDVVIKAPQPGVANDADFAGRFDREIRSLVHLAHPHVVKVVDAGKHDGLPFAVLQYLPGGNLRQRQRRLTGKQRGPVPPQDFRDWLPQVAAALDYIHGQHHVHRDVKPENILFDQAGNAFLGDFGVVKVLNADRERKQATVRTISGHVLGTPQYMAPEILAGQHYDGRVDQYALAITVYELLAGRYPFDGPTAAVVFSKQLSEPPPPLASAVPGLPPGVIAAVEGALAKKPEDRFPNCVAFARAFVAGLNGEGAPTPSHAGQRTPAAPSGSLSTKVSCPTCGKKLKGLVPGKRYQCPGCRASFAAPSSALPTAAVLPRDSADSGTRPVFHFDDPLPASPRRSLAAWFIGGGALVVLALASVVALSMSSEDGPPPRDEQRISRSKEKSDFEKEKKPPEDHPPLQQQPPEKTPPKVSVEEKPPPAQPPRQKPPQERPPDRKPPDKPPVKPPDKPPVKPPDKPPQEKPSAGLVHTLRGHTEFIHCVAITPDGKWVLTGGGGKAVGGELKTGTDFDLRIWDLQSGARVGMLSGHKDNVACVAVSPDSSRVASGSQDGKIFLWDLKTRHKEKELPGHREGTTAIAFSPRGSYLASAGFDGVVHVWDVKSGELLRSLHGHTASLLAVLFTPDGKYLLSAGFDKTIRLWDLATGKEPRVFSGHADPVCALALSPDGKRLLSGSGLLKGSDPGLRLWDLEGKQLAHLPTPGDPVRSVCFVPDGRQAVCCGEEGFLCLWDLEKRKRLRRDEAHEGYATGVALSPDGRWAVTVGLDGVAKVWHLPEPGPLVTWAELSEIKITKESAVSVRQPDVKPANPKALLRRFEKHTEAVRALAVTPDGRMALSGGGGVFVNLALNRGTDHSLLFWEVETGDVKFRFEGHVDIVTSLAILPDGKRALSASSNGDLLLWNLTTGKQAGKLVFNGLGLGTVNSVAVSRDGAVALTGGTQLVPWNLKTSRNFKPITGQPATIQCVALSPDGRQALAGDEFGTVILWNLATGLEVRRFKGHSNIVWSVAFSRDGKYVATGSGGRVGADRVVVEGNDNTVRLWDTATGKELKVFRGHKDAVRSVAFSTNGKRVLSGDRDGAVFLWDVSGGKDAIAFQGHTTYAQQVVFLPGDRRALSASLDKTVCLWQLPE